MSWIDPSGRCSNCYADLSGSPDSEQPDETVKTCAANAGTPELDASDLYAENQRLRGSLRHVTDMLAELLQAERFPGKGRSADDKEQTQGWWEDHVGAVQKAYATLAGEEDVLGWVTAHPGLYIPPPGLIKLDRS